LKYAALAGTTWDINIIESTGGCWTSIALDADGYPHISYIANYPYEVKYAYAYCGYVLAGDRNDDCKVDFRDFAVTAKNWLIDCDETPGNPACIPK